MTNMVPLESSPLFGVFSYGGCSSGGGDFTEAMMMRETTINNQDSSGDTCSVSDPTVGSTSYYNISSSPVTTAKKDGGSTAKNDDVCCVNIEDQDKSWLRLGIGPEDNKNNNKNNTQSYKLQRCCSKNSSGRENSLELSLFSSSSTAAGAVSSSVDHPQQPPQSSYSHDQLLTMRGASLVYNHQFIRPQTLLNPGFSFPSSKSWIPQYTAPFRPSSLGMMSDRDVTNSNRVARNCFVDERGAGPSCSEFRVLNPPKRPHSGLWFLLQASQYQEKEPFLPQVNKSYLRIKDGRITVRLLIKYLMKKLQLDSESEIEIRCRGQQLSPLLTMQHVRDTIWSPKSSLPSLSPSFTLLRDSSTSDHVMILHYGRTA